MIKDFLKSSMIYTIATIFTRSISIFLIPIYTRYLSTYEYGMIDYFMILGSIINIIVSLEIYQAVLRYYQDSNSLDEKKEYVSTAFIFYCIMYLLYFFISYIFSYEFAELLLDNKNMSSLIIMGSVAIISNGIFIFTQNQLRFELRPKEFAIGSIINIIIIASLSTYLLIFKEFKIDGVLIAQIIGNLVAAVFSFFISRKSYGFIFIYDRLKQMIHFSFPVVFSSIATFLVIYIDRIAIKDLLGLNDLGIYALAYKFASIAGLVIVGIQSSLTPLIYKYYKDEKTPYNIVYLFNIFSGFALLVIAGSIVLSKDIISLLVTENFYSASELVPFLVATMFVSNLYIFTPGIVIAKKTKQASIIMVIGAILNIILNYILIPIFGINGAGFATLLSSIFVFFIYAIYSHRYYIIPFNIRGIISNLVLILFSAYLVYSISNSIIVKLLYLILLSFILIFLIKQEIKLIKIKNKFK